MLSAPPQLTHLLQSTGANIGIGFRDFGSGEGFVIGGGEFVMQSVYKLPIAFSVMRGVDEGRFGLKDKFLYDEGGLELGELVNYSVSRSDNKASDILLKLVGGPKRVRDDLEGLGIRGIKVVSTEEEMQSNFNIQFENTSSVEGMLDLLEVIAKGKVLKKESNDFLLKSMFNASTGDARIKAGLPKDFLLAHKTGTSGKDDEGRYVAVNDVGIIVLPDGRMFGLVIFIMNSSEDILAIEGRMAEIVRGIVLSIQ